uniref:NADH-ubiquinone oxidoreductase chain 2 n=1 Tax=Liriomyza chinensis TaxID=237616 RepID=A0A3S7N7J1_9MUSC|nr:NADH dehydrogenase subunit 2 [Liriomyza chinensis]AWX34625.1 NADH dehydrogenase subunit 2 [Liriomyza chinensis]
MFNNSYKIMFLLILMMGTMITISSNSWLSAWMGLEINLLSFIPLMNDNNLMSTESSLKYFLIQALASTVFIFFSIFLMLENFYSIQINLSYAKILILSAILLKMGAAPFHFWFPSVMQGLMWTNAYILMTWQKIAPIFILSYVIYKPLIIFCAISSAICGAIGGFNQTSLTKLMAYSSINHMGWMLIAMLKNESMWILYFIFYSLLNFTVILLFKMFNMSHINQMFSMLMNSKPLKFMTFFNLLSLGGLPPFLGFIPKWLIIQSLTFENQYLLLMILIVSALISLYFYLRMGYTAFMLNYTEMNWTLTYQYNKILMNLYLICSSMSIFGLYSISFIYIML